MCISAVLAYCGVSRSANKSTKSLLLRSLGVHDSLLTICNTCNIGISSSSRGGVGGTCLPNGACFLWLESSPWESHMIGWCHHVGYAAENNVPSLLETSVFLYTIVTGHRIQGHCWSFVFFCSRLRLSAARLKRTTWLLMQRPRVRNWYRYIYNIWYHHWMKMDEIQRKGIEVLLRQAGCWFWRRVQW